MNTNFVNILKQNLIVLYCHRKRNLMQNCQYRPICQYMECQNISRVDCIQLFYYIFVERIINRSEKLVIVVWACNDRY